jgi:hypothetical protein
LAGPGPGPDAPRRAFWGLTRVFLSAKQGGMQANARGGMGGALGSVSQNSKISGVRHSTRYGTRYCSTTGHKARKKHGALDEPAMVMVICCISNGAVTLAIQNVYTAPVHVHAVQHPVPGTVASRGIRHVRITGH